MTEIDRLAADLRQHIQTYGRALLVIDGDCAAGKTTLAARIAAQTQCDVFHMDDFFLPPALRTEARLTEAGGNIDYDRFAAQVLTPLLTNKPFVYEAYSCKTGALRTVNVAPGPVSVIEGSYALHPRFLKTYEALRAIKVFIRVSPEEQIRRIRNRNGEAMLRRFQEEWIPMEKRYHQTHKKAWGVVRFIDG